MKKIKIKEGFTGQRSVELPKAIIDMQENDPLVSTLFVTYIGYYPKAHHHYVDRSIPITHYVLIYCVEGCGHYRVRNHDYTVKRTNILSFRQMNSIFITVTRQIPGQFTGYISVVPWLPIMQKVPFHRNPSFPD